MWKELLGLVKSKDDLLSEAYDDCTEMLLTTKKMFGKIVSAMRSDVSADILGGLREMDIELNQEQRAVRKKVVEHLALSHGEGLITGLVLVSIVIDLERIGDYTKNLAEVIEMVPDRIDNSEYTVLIDELVGSTDKLFDDTLLAFRDNDREAARKVAVCFGELSPKCNAELKKAFQSASCLDTVPKEMMAYVLIVRYIKRVSAHLHNIASATGGPFHRIGYKFHDRNKK